MWKSLNRTSVGLKRQRSVNEATAASRSGLNRTSVGLKQSIEEMLRAGLGGASIEPAWD